MEPERWRRRIEGRDGLITSSVAKRERSPCQEDDGSQGGKRFRYSGPSLPEDMWRHIHSLMPMRDAARVACVSHAFLYSWRCHPNLILSKRTLRMKDNEGGEDFIRTVDSILKKYSGNMKTFSLNCFTNIGKCFDMNLCPLNNWLEIAVAPGIEEITLHYLNREYSFPCSLLSDGVRNSIRRIELACCAFHPTIELGPFRSLVKLEMFMLVITEDELGYVLSNSFALEQLLVFCCHEIIFLKIPYHLRRLSYLRVCECKRLKLVENNAPNLSTFFFTAQDNQVELSLGESLNLKDINVCCNSITSYARSKFPSSVPNLERLTITSYHEVANIPMLSSKFFYLKYMSISLHEWSFCHTFDYFSLISVLDASPSLESFTLNMNLSKVHTSILADSSDMRQTTKLQYNKLKNVKITNFSSLKSLVELTCHILEHAVSLECLTLDMTSGLRMSHHDTKSGKCSYVSKSGLIEAPKALLAIQTYIEGKVPSTVNLCVLEPCSLCHVLGHQREQSHGSL